MIKRGFFILLIFWLEATAIIAQVKQHHQYALTPPMGWNSWNCFKRYISESQIKEIADLMASKGLRDAGYEYLVIDDGWAIGRRKNGEVYADSVKFPNGIKKLAEYVHSKGLKFGIYTGPGKTTCAGYVGSLGYEQQDVNTYAQWGVDFIKLDWCSGGDDERENIAARWRKVLDKVNRPMVLSINFGQEAYNWASNYANMWRTTTDISPCWDLPITETGGLPCSVLGVVDQQPGLEQFQTPGAWNDPDMMQVGNGSLTESENRSHLSLWAVLGAPMMMGNDLRKMTPEITELLTNREVIAINQDKLGFQGRKISDSGEDIRKTTNTYGQEVWVKKLQSTGEYAVVLLNRSDFKTYMKVNWKDLGIDEQNVIVRDLWKHQDMGAYDHFYAGHIPPHDVMMLRVKGKQQGTLQPLFQELKDSIAVEAEQGLLARAIKGSAYGGKYKGSGYVEFLSSTSRERYIRLVVNMPADGTYSVGLRYANGEKHEMKMMIYTGDKMTDLNCRPTKSFGDWDYAFTKVELTKGLNVIKIISDQVRCPLIDQLIVKN